MQFTNIQDLINQATKLEFQKSLENDIEKGTQPIGAITTHNDGKQYKKVAEGDWRPVSEKGMTKKEHQDKQSEHLDHTYNAQQKNEDSEVRRHLEVERKHGEAAKKLSDKEYSDDEVHGKEKEIVDIENISDQIVDWASSGTASGLHEVGKHISPLVKDLDKKQAKELTKHLGSRIESSEGWTREDIDWINHNIGTKGEVELGYDIISDDDYDDDY